MSNTPEPTEQSPHSDSPNTTHVNVNQDVDKVTGSAITGVGVSTITADIVNIISYLNPPPRPPELPPPVLRLPASPDEPPYGLIADALKRGRVIPFLGAGASLSGRPPDKLWDASAPFLPLGSELSRHLAELSNFPSNDPTELSDLPIVASYYAQRAGDREMLVSYVHDVFDRDYQIGPVHRFLADLAMPLLIVTTNYDDLIERAFKEKTKQYHLVTSTDDEELAASVLWWKPGETQPSAYHPTLLPLSLTDTSIIYKMHGSVARQIEARDSFVITEEDFEDFLVRMIGQTAIPKRFMAEFYRRHFLFLGYGLRDWNLRVMLKYINTALGTAQADAEVTSVPATNRRPTKPRVAWSVQRQPTKLEETLWATRKVNIYNADTDVFIAALRKQLGI